MKQIELKIAGKIWVKKSDCDRELRALFRKNFSFKSNKTFNGNLEFRTIYSSQEVGTEIYYTFPANFDYFKDKIIDKTSGEIDWIVVDERVAPIVEGFTSNVVPREHQIPILEDIKRVNYNAILSLPTSTGKTVLALYLTEILKTRMLFVATRVSLIQNLLKDAKQFGIPNSEITEVSTEWFRNPVYSTIMYCTMQTLNAEILGELNGNIGLLIGEETHLGFSGEGNSDKIFELNPKYRLYLSATYKSSDYGEEFSKALLSSNVITAEETINYKIKVHSFYLEREQSFHNKYNKVYTSHERKEIMYDRYNLNALKELAYYLVKRERRGVLIYVEDKLAQNAIAELLRLLCLRVGILNSDTKKADSSHIINNFDNGDYDVIVAGNSISAGVSLYRLSVIINLNITSNENNLIQLIGRMKRFNPEVCDKDKIYIQFCVKALSQKKWEKDCKVLDKFDYIDFQKVTNISMSEYCLMNAYKSLSNN